MEFVCLGTAQSASSFGSLSPAIAGGTGTDTIELTANGGSTDFNATTGVEKILVVDNAVQGSDAVSYTHLTLPTNREV